MTLMEVGLMKYKIGDFSKITKISSRMLRYLDNENLLKPCWVEDNGYRYYSHKEVEKAAKIMRLKKYHFTYSEIKNILDNQLEENQQIYRDQLASIKSVAKDYDLLIQTLEGESLGEGCQILNPYDILTSERKAFYALKKSAVIMSHEVDLFLEATVNASRQPFINFLGSYFVTMDYSIIEEKGGQDTEVIQVTWFQPIDDKIVVEGFETVEFEAAQWVSTLHYGNYDHLFKAYEQLFVWAEEHEVKLREAVYEKYYVDPYYASHQSEYITEIFAIISN